MDKILWYLVIGLIIIGPSIHESIAIRSFLGLENRKVGMAVYSTIFIVLWPPVFLWWVASELMNLGKKDDGPKP